MNSSKVREIIKRYEREFESINDKELYKWSAVKCFQDHWNIDSKNFSHMLRLAFADADNLLTNSNYYPLRMLYQVADNNPEAVRSLFIQLFDEELDLSRRIDDFEADFESLNEKYFPGMDDY